MNELKFKTFLVKDAMGKIVQIIRANEYLIHKFLNFEYDYTLYFLYMMCMRLNTYTIVA